MADPTDVNSQITDAVTSSAAPTLPLGRFVWHDLMTTDVARARAYYSELLGWTYDEVEVQGYGKYPMIRASGQNWGGIVAVDEGKAIPSHWISYCTVSDVDAAVAKATGLGGRVYVDGEDIPEVGRFAVISDGQGATIAPYRPLKPAGEGVQGGAWEGTFCWHELLANDPAAEAAFFAEIFQWDAVEQQFEGGPYTLFKRKDTGKDAGGMLPKPPGSEGPSSWLPYVAVPDAGGTARRVRELGGKIWVEPMDVAGIGRFLVTGDPTGAMIAFLQPSA
jgi:hypothetical protein